MTQPTRPQLRHKPHTHYENMQCIKIWSFVSSVVLEKKHLKLSTSKMFILLRQSLVHNLSELANHSKSFALGERGLTPSKCWWKHVGSPSDDSALMTLYRKDFTENWPEQCGLQTTRSSLPALRTTWDKSKFFFSWILFFHLDLPLLKHDLFFFISKASFS